MSKDVFCLFHVVKLSLSLRFIDGGTFLKILSHILDKTKPMGQLRKETSGRGGLYLVRGAVHGAVLWKVNLGLFTRW